MYGVLPPRQHFSPQETSGAATREDASKVYELAIAPSAVETSGDDVVIVAPDQVQLTVDSEKTQLEHILGEQ